MKNHILVLALGSAMALSACGGGGGGGGGSTTTPPVTTTPPASTLTAINATNATSAAANAYAATTSVGSSSTPLTGILTGVSVSNTNINTVAPLLQLVKHAYGRQQLLTGVTVNETDPCTGGGNLVINGTVNNPDNVSNGDTLTITANSCVENGQTLSGGFSVKFSGVSGNINTAVFGVTMDSTFNSFNITSGTDKIGVNGDMKVVLNQTSASASNIALSGNSLKTTEQQGSATAVERTVTAYTVTGSTVNGVNSSAANFGLSGTSPKLGTFSYTVQNKQPFVFSTSSAVVPSSGSLIVNGNASSVTATVVATGVQVDLTAGGSTQSNTVAWDAFLSSM